jgi:hypothetical protein|tara:strand:+ start:1719 stop:1991 length:273 start_codon:yes stop_codon:yes gene_type:complete
MGGGIIKGVLRALTAYLELRNKTHYHRVVSESRDKQKKLINEIETLRTAGDVDSNDRADLLRDELLDEKRHLEHISTFYLKSCGGDTDPE